MMMHFLKQHIKQLVQQTATHVMDAGGVVRALDSWGTLTLPQRMRRHKQYHLRGECVHKTIHSFLFLDQL